LTTILWIGIEIHKLWLNSQLLSVIKHIS